MEVNMSWIKLTDVSGNRICVNTDKVEQIKEKICYNGEKETQIFFSDNTQETVKESYDFVLSQLEM
jgi:uncharacterized protein YlzI (FlbEa/FlbD family)